MEKEESLLRILDLEPNLDGVEESRTAYDLYMRAEEYLNILKQYQKKLREVMFELAEKEGVEDEKGSHIVKFPDGKGFKKEARHYILINEERAKELSEQKGLDLVERIGKITEKNEEIREMAVQFLEENLPDALDYEENIDEDRIEQAFMSGELTEEEFKEMVNRDIRYALRKYK